MSDEHLTGELLDQVFEGRVPVSRMLARVLEHLVGLCPVCQQELAAWQERRLDLGAVASESYAGSFQRLERRLRRDSADLARQRVQAKAWLGELLPLAPEQRLERIRRARTRLRGRFLAEGLLAASREALPGRPEESFHLARAAQEVTLRSALEEAEADPLLAQALALLGNARRSLGDHRQAETHLAAARERVEEGVVPDPLVRGEVAALEGVLRKDQRRFQEAETLLERAVRLYGEAGEPVRAARVLITLAPLYDIQGQPERAVGVVSRALEELDPEEEPRLYLGARYNLAFYLHSAGRHREAMAVLSGDAELYARSQDPALAVRLRWLQGKLAFALEDLAEAEAAFVEVRATFQERGQAFDVASVALDQALLDLQQGRWAEVQAVAREAVDYFASQAVHREAAGALLLFRQAAEAQEVTVRQIRRLARYLDQARHDPALRFEE